MPHDQHKLGGGGPGYFTTNRIVVGGNLPASEGHYQGAGSGDQGEINQAIADGPGAREYPWTVTTKGHLFIDGPILYPSWTRIINEGKIELEDNVNLNMFENMNPATHDVEIDIVLGTIDGNRDNNPIAGNIVYHRNATQILPGDRDHKWVNYRDGKFIDGAINGIVIDFAGSSESNLSLSRLRGRFADNLSIHLHDVADFFMNDIQTEGDQGALLDGCGIGHINGVYFNQRLEMLGCAMVVGDGINIDLGQDTDALIMNNAHRCTLDNILIRYVGSIPAVNNAAIYLQNSTGNLIRGVRAGRFGGAGTNRFNFIIEETASCVNNLYKDIRGDDYVTALADLQGSGHRLSSLPVSLNRYNGAANGAHGVTVSGAFQAGVGSLPLPSDVQEIQFITLAGYSHAAVGQEMEIELQVNGHAGNEPFGTHAQNIANLDSLETGVAVGDAVSWRVRSRDYAPIRAITGLDRFEISVIYEAGAGGDGNTNMDIGSVLLEYL